MISAWRHLSRAPLWGAAFLRLVAVATAVVALHMGVSASVASAATYVVDRTDDPAVDPDNPSGCLTPEKVDGDCSLRQAIIRANANTDHDVIKLPESDQPYTLSIANDWEMQQDEFNHDVLAPVPENDSFKGDLDIKSHITIIGVAANDLHADGDPSRVIVQAGTNSADGIDKILTINPEPWDLNIDAVIKNITFRYGRNQYLYSTFDTGAAVEWDGFESGSLLIENCVMEHSSSANLDGGGLSVFFGPRDPANPAVQIKNTRISNNSVSRGNGGGVRIFESTAEITDSIISHNNAYHDGRGGYGAGLDSVDATSLVIRNTTIHDNVGTGFRGGGMNITTHRLTIENSTIRDNEIMAGDGEGSGGGGIWVSLLGTADNIRTATFQNVTFSGNKANAFGGAMNLSAGDYSQYELINVTVANNRADADGNSAGGGGGLYVSITSATGTVTLKNTIVAKNYLGTGSSPHDIWGTVTSGQHSLVGDADSSGGLTHGENGNLVGVDPLLGPLADNGGPTLTHALLHGSPALDGGGNVTGLPATDQRGVPRSRDSSDSGDAPAPDIGAYEAHPWVEEIPDQTMDENTTHTVHFSAGDGAHIDLVVATARPEDQGLIPNSGLAVSGSGSNRTLSITPEPDQFGTAVITVTVTDTVSGETFTAADTFTLTVNAVPDPPSITPTTTAEDTQSTTGLVIETDHEAITHFLITDITGGTLYKSDGNQIANGTFITRAEGTAGLTFTPGENQNSQEAGDTFTFTVQGAQDASGTGLTDPVNAMITVTAVNDPPVGNDDSLSSVAEDSATRTIPFATLLGNDSTGPANESGQILTITAVSDAVGGTASISGTDVLFTPAENFHGTASFTYTLQDNGKTDNVDDFKTATAMVTFPVTPVADTPSVTNATTYVNEQTTDGLVISRNPADGAEVTHFQITNITGGTLYQHDGETPIQDGEFITFAEGNAGLRFTPAQDSPATGHFTVQAATSDSDAGLGGGTVTAEITVAPPNPDLQLTKDDGGISVLGGETIVYTLSFTNVGVDATGVVMTETVPDHTRFHAGASSPGWSCDPDGSAGSACTLDYGDLAQGTSDTVIFAVTVANPANGITLISNTASIADDGANGADPTPGNNSAADTTPVLHGPVAADDSYSVDEDDTLTVAAPGVLANDSDGDGDALTAALVESATHGSLTLDPDGSFIYSPDANYHGSDQFTYKVSDGTYESGTATVSITIEPVNDPPVAQDGSVAVAGGSSVSGTLVATDLEGEALTFSIVDQPAKGQVVLDDFNTGAFTYTPDDGVIGADSFTFKANDGTADSNLATITIEVSNAPVANDDGYQTDEDQMLTVTAPGVLANDTDADGDSLTAVLETEPDHGVLTLNADGSFSYLPDDDFAGDDQFTYRAYDGELYSTTATVAITVTPVNDAPVAHDGSLTAPEGYTTSGILSAADADGDQLAFSIVSQPGKGTVTIDDVNTGEFTYEAGEFVTGTDSFTFQVTDGTLDSNVATVTITLTNRPNTPPVAANDSYSVDEDDALTVDAPGVLANDTDAEGDSLTVSLVSGTATGVVILHADGSFSYTPEEDFNGSDQFTYRVYDPRDEGNTATVTITVNPVNDAPVAQDDDLTAVSGASITGTLLAADIDGDTLTFSVVTPPGQGSVTIDDVNSGAFTYTGHPGAAGTDSFTFRVNDGTADSNPATVTLTFTAGLYIAQSGGSTVVAEGGAGDTYTVMLTAEPTADVTIEIIPDISGQVELSPTTLTFTPVNWNSPQTVTVAALDDPDAEGTQTITITHGITSADPDYGSMDDMELTVQVLDNDIPGITVHRTGGSTVVREGVGSDTYGVTLNSKPTADVTIKVTTGRQLRVTPATLSFTPDNWNVPQTVTVTARDDDQVEGTHLAIIRHTGESADLLYHGFEFASETVTIRDNDRAPSDNAFLRELLIRPGSLEPAFDRAVSGYAVAVPYRVDAVELAAVPEDINAAMSIDGSPQDRGVARRLELAVGPNTFTILVTAENKTATRRYTVTVIRDVAPEVLIEESGGTTAVAEGGEGDRYTLVLSKRPAMGVTVSLAPDSQVKVEPVIVLFTPDNWNVPRTVRVSAVDDAAVEGDHAGEVAHKVSSGDPEFQGLAVRSVSVRVADDDQAAVPDPGLVVDETFDSGMPHLAVGQGGVKVELPACRAGEVRLTVRRVNLGEWNLDRAAAPAGFRTVGSLGWEAELVSAATGAPVRCPAAMTLPVDPAGVDDPDKVSLFYLNPFGVLTYMGGRLQDGVLVVRVPHLSRFVPGYVQVRFPDLEGHPARADAELLAARLVVQGLPDGRFLPDAPVSRAQFVAMLVRAMGLMGPEPATGLAGGAGFRDVAPSDWFYTEVMAAARAGIVQGGGNGAFRPHDPVTHEEAVLMLVRALQLGGRLTVEPGAEEVSARLAPDADQTGATSRAGAAGMIAWFWRLYRG